MNRVAEEVVGSIAIPQSVEGPKRENDGFVRLGVDVVFHPDVLKPPLPKGNVSEGLLAQARGNRCRWILTICGDVDACAYRRQIQGSGLMQKRKFARKSAGE